jgi:hypothetical protein
MILCDDGHDEVCYDGRNCPACELLKEIGKIEEITADLRDEIEELMKERG